MTAAVSEQRREAQRLSGERKWDEARAALSAALALGGAEESKGLIAQDMARIEQRERDSARESLAAEREAARAAERERIAAAEAQLRAALNSFAPTSAGLKSLGTRISALAALDPGNPLIQSARAGAAQRIAASATGTAKSGHSSTLHWRCLQKRRFICPALPTSLPPAHRSKRCSSRPLARHRIARSPRHEMHFEPSSIGHSQPKEPGNAKRTLRSQRCAGLLEAKMRRQWRESNWPRRISMQPAGSSTKSVSRWRRSCWTRRNNSLPKSAASANEASAMDAGVRAEQGRTRRRGVGSQGRCGKTALRQ